MTGAGWGGLTAADLESRLESRVLALDLSPGAKLDSERALAEEFGVGRPLVREVLRRLEERGLVTIVPGRGTFVQDLPLTEGGGSIDLLARRGRVTPRQLIVARSMLESEAASLAASARTEEDLARMDGYLRILASGVSAIELVEADVRFHEAIAIASGNPVIQILFGSVRKLVRGVIVRSISDRVVKDLAFPSHGLIHDAIRAGDSHAAREAMLAHLDVASRLYGQDLDRPLRDVLGQDPTRIALFEEELRMLSIAQEYGLANPTSVHQ